MRREPKLSSDNELDIKYILTFTAAFVVISSVILVAGYALLSVTGILGNSQAEVTDGPMPTPTPTARPTYIAIGVPTDIPDPTPTPTPRPPTPTPSPTPVPSPYKLTINIDQSEASSMIYTVILGMKQGYQPLDLTHTTLTIRNGDTVYCDYSFSDAMYWLDGNWSNSNEDNRLDPTGESLKLRISAYSLKIPLDVETRLILSLDGTTVVNFPLPAFQNNADLSQLQDPGSDNVVRWY
jgi:hypothetical protein